MSVFDGFIFFNEFAQLDIRLHELADLVGYHILVECPKTFTGHDKPLYFQENKAKFAEFLPKIIHIILPPVDDFCVWRIEKAHRNAIIDKIELKSDDIVMISQVDEIPSKNAFQSAVNALRMTNLPQVVTMDVFYYGLNCRLLNAKTPFFGGAVGFRGQMESAHGFWSRRAEYNENYGGWHYSNFLPISDIQYKLQSYSHKEFNKPPYNSTGYIQDCINKRIGFLPNIEQKFEIIKLSEENTPAYILGNSEHFKHLIV